MAAQFGDDVGGEVVGFGDEDFGGDWFLVC